MTKLTRRTLLAVLAGAPIAAKAQPEIVSREIVAVEVAEYYAGGRLVRRTIAGQDVPFHHQRQPFVILKRG